MFKSFKNAISDKYESIKSSPLFFTEVSKDEMWETYLKSFPAGTDMLYKERTEHDCQSCRRFIKAVGNMVAIIDNKVVSIWDVVFEDDDVKAVYQPVVDALSAIVKEAPIRNVLFHTEPTAGVDRNHQLLEDSSILTWEHLYLKLPSSCVLSGDDIGPKHAYMRSTFDVFKRGLKEINSAAIDTVIEITEQGSLYRGDEHLTAVKFLNKHKDAVEDMDEQALDLYCWQVTAGSGNAHIRIRNTAIGTLLIDLSEGMELNAAVDAYGHKMDPNNYKRTKAIATPAMIRRCEEKVTELGFMESLPRRDAVAEDLTINNVLFANRESKVAMNVFDEMVAETPVPVESLEKVEEVTIDNFLANVLPKATSLEIMVENKHVNNMVSLLAPVNKEAPGMFKWGNNFSWSYMGEVTDSIKERVKKAGGAVDGVLRFSIQWNDGDGFNRNDMDAHCHEPKGNVISYCSKVNGRTGGNLDVDIINPVNGKPAVENITWPNIDRMEEGTYKFFVHTYSHRGGHGFKAQIEYDGVIHDYIHTEKTRSGEKVLVAEVKFSRANGIEFVRQLPSTTSSKEVWNTTTQNFQKVSMVMLSPNHWDDKKIGNKHVFFMLEGCRREGPARGFYNEFLIDELREHRKSFEMLSEKMRVPESENTLSGLGFSSTQRNHVFCKVAGTFNRTIKITF